MRSLRLSLDEEGKERNTGGDVHEPMHDEIPEEILSTRRSWVDEQCRSFGRWYESDRKDVHWLHFFHSPIFHFYDHFCSFFDVFQFIIIFCFLIISHFSYIFSLHALSSRSLGFELHSPNFFVCHLTGVADIQR